MDTRKIAAARRLKALEAIHRFGYLRALDVAVLLLGRVDGSSVRIAQRILARMVELRLVVMHRGKVGDHAHYAIAEAGARFLRQEGHEHARSSTDTLKNSGGGHRDAANIACFLLERQGWPEYCTERQIQTGRGVVRELGKKVPDALAFDRQEGLVAWVEVENCRRGWRDMQSLASWLLRTAFPEGMREQRRLMQLAEGLFLDKVVFVIASPKAATFQTRLCRHLGVTMDSEQHATQFCNDYLQFLVLPSAKV